MPTIVVTAGATNANSYVSVDTANTYHDENLNVTDWADAILVDRERAVIMATRLLDAYVEWHGTKVSTSQALAWPLTLDIVIPNSETIVSTIIPQFLERATAEFAKFLLVKDRVVDSKTKGIKEVGAGPARVVFDSFEQPDVIPDVVQQMIAPYGVVAGFPNGRVERGA